MRNVLVDAGPLIALLDVNDDRHAWAVAQLKRLPLAITTVWPAVTEAAHMLAKRGPGPEKLLAALANSGVEIAAQDSEDYAALHHLVEQYDDLPMDLADAALVHAYHRDGFDAVMTTDIRDFSVYRVAGKPLRLITPRD